MATQTSPSKTHRAAAAGAVVLGAYIFGVRPWHIRWGATDAEWSMRLPGDDLVPQPRQQSTRAITISAPASAIYPWLVQIGQGRAGMYSYDWLENLIGCDLHSAEQIVPEWQNVQVGDLVRMGPQGYPQFKVAALIPNRALVLAGANPSTGLTYHETTPPPADALNTSWTFYLNPINAHVTRLIVRNRLDYRLTAANVLIWRTTEAVQFVMEQKMMRGIRERAERGA